jgi:hypothetical protein
MNFWASSEVHSPASLGSEAVRRFVVPYINAALTASTLGEVQVEVRYVPIIMPAAMKSRYPARTRVVKRTGTYDCAPQLDYDVFVEGTFMDQVDEYLRPFLASGAHLSQLGLAQEDIAQFEEIVRRVIGAARALAPDDKR